MTNDEGNSGVEDDALPPQELINSPPRILVVDDDVYMRDLMVKTLVRSGYAKVDIARDGIEAWNALHEVYYHLVITDHVMPKVTGLELIKKMRSKGMRQPVILVSGTIPTEALARNPGLQVDAILSKPFTATELLATMEATMRAAGSLTVTKRNPAPNTEAHLIAPAQGHAEPPFRILIVDDDSESRQFSINLLIASGYDADGVNDGAAGWEALQTYDYDLVITDNHMPRMTGLEMIEKLNAARMTVPIIMATGNLPMDEFARRPWLKPDATLQKPFASDALLGMVRNVLGTDDGNEDRTTTPHPKYT
jgi:DNA-binding response OmpR family regulator